MGSANTTRRTDKPITAYPFYWFSILEQAIEKRDFRRALEAQERLERLGYKIQFVKPAEGRVADAG